MCRRKHKLSSAHQTHLKVGVFLLIFHLHTVWLTNVINVIGHGSAIDYDVKTQL